MTHMSSAALVGLLRQAARPLTGRPEDYDELLGQMGRARCVLIGEASHGTHEFYRTRAELTQRLIAEHGFTAVAAEADWPDAYRVNCYVRGAGADATPEQALGDFGRFPTWMWRNRDVAAFVGWLRDHNRRLPDGGPKVGFYGLDLYSMYTSIRAVIRYLDEADPDEARRARQRYSCFDHFSSDPQHYGYVAGTSGATCEDAVVEQLVELQRRAGELARRDGQSAEDALFYAQQNARLVRNAEQYYRSMFRGRVSSWNLRDTHMAETLDALLEHLGRRGDAAKVVVWAHNSHLGDARATEMGDGGEVNLGQLARERYGDAVFLLGFSTYTGSVTAAADWDQPPERRWVRPGLPESYEGLFHAVGAGEPRLRDFLLPLDRAGAVPEGLRSRRLQRAIGVVYRPETERHSHYFYTRLPDQFDALIHFDTTSAVEPLERSAGWERAEPPETFPTGI